MFYIIIIAVVALLVLTSFSLSLSQEHSMVFIEELILRLL